MIGKLTGQVSHITADALILDVSGVGYLVYCARGVLQNLQPGQLATLYIETYVREDAIKLFGFASMEAKEMFLLLQSVSGVGTKVALAILSSLGVDQIYQAILSSDKALLATVSGVGQKTAERILLELKGKKIIATQGIFQGAFTGQNNSSVFNDAILALEALGVSRSESWSVVEKILAQDSQAPIDDIIRQALILRK